MTAASTRRFLQRDPGFGQTLAIERRVRHHLAARGEAEHELVAVARDHVDEAHAVDDRSGAERRNVLRSGEVERLARPGTFVHVVFTIAGAMRAKRDEKRMPMPTSPPGMNWLSSDNDRASEASANSFELWLAACTDFSRSSGSAMWVPSGTTIADT